MAQAAAKDAAQKVVQTTARKLGEIAAKAKLRKRNLYDLMYERPNNGLGEKFTRARWKMPGWFWTVTRVTKTIDVQ